jgi:hypothetical protein
MSVYHKPFLSEPNHFIMEREKPLLCQIYFCDLSTLDHLVEGVAFPKADAPS